MKVYIIDEDTYPDDRDQVIEKGNFVIEVKDGEVSKYYIYGDSRDIKKLLTIPDGMYYHREKIYLFKDNNLEDIIGVLAFDVNNLCDYFGVGEVDVYECSGYENCHEDDLDYDDYDDDNNDNHYDTEDNYAEEVRRYELNRMYRDYDEYCDYASNDSEDLDYQYSEDNGYDPY